ncbi:MAG: hypothetical protein INF81_03450 [Roseomonas sp.]|nr:hypothetical protein [Roseomonas sp.]MCA3428223.1 hypothetical protein [Roseomonas sp.]
MNALFAVRPFKPAVEDRIWQQGLTMFSQRKIGFALATVLVLAGCADRADPLQVSETLARPCLGEDRIDRPCHKNRSWGNNDPAGQSRTAGGFGLLALPIALLVATYDIVDAPNQANRAAARRVLLEDQRPR